MSEQEDRGTSYSVWVLPNGDATFCPVPVGIAYTISVPIGWKLESDPKYGIIFRHYFGHILTATSAFKKAQNEESFFRLRTPQASESRDNRDKRDAGSGEPEGASDAE